MQKKKECRCQAADMRFSSRRSLLISSSLAVAMERFVPRNAWASTAPLVRLYGPINQDSCVEFVDQLVMADAVACETGFPICAHIQSLGGDLMPIFHVLDVIDGLSAPLWTYIDGYAASAATLISVYGERRFMTKRSTMLIHELRTSVEGPYSRIVSDAAHSQQLMEKMCEVYLQHSTMEEDALSSLMRRDLWLNSTQALALGLVDLII